MWLWGLTIDSVTIINLVLAIGLVTSLNLNTKAFMEVGPMSGVRWCKLEPSLKAPGFKF